MEPDWWNQLAPDTSGESYGARNQCRLLRHSSQVSACSVPCWRVRERTPAKALQLTCGALFGHCRSSSSSNPSKSLQSDCHLLFSDCHYTSAVLRRVLQVVSATGGFLSLPSCQVTSATRLQRMFQLQRSTQYTISSLQLTFVMLP